MADDNNTEGMLGVYLFENNQLLERLQEIVLEQKDEECFDSDAINEIFRIMHTIKGSSGVMMFDQITAIAHKLEDVFFYLRESGTENASHMQLIEHVLEVGDFISGEMDKLQDGEEADADASEIIARVDDFLASLKGDKKEEIIQNNVSKEPEQFYIAPTSSKATIGFYKIYITYRADTQMSNIHAYKLVHSLNDVVEDMLYCPDDIISNEHSGDVILEDGFKMLLKTSASMDELNDLISEGLELEKVDIYECDEKEFKQGFVSGDNEEIKIDLESSVEDIEKKKQDKKGEEEKEDKKITPGDFVIESKGPGKAKKLAKDKPKKSEKASYISVDVKKMDMLMDLIGELVISESVVLQNPDLKVPGLKLDNFNKAVAQMTKIATDLQNVIMSMRMVPLQNTFQKMNRIVFDVSRKLGKDVEFEMIGEHTEVDRNIIEHISDPLMHLVRNSVDHGIESNEERQELGKDKGKVTLSAKTESGKVWISVKDNGAGLSRDKIFAKAKKQGLIDPYKQESAYSDKEIYNFITLPGFSTNEKVTEYSGRGVGMDVVVSNIQAIGGNLDIESTEGVGSTMNMKIPLTLAIIDGIVFYVGKSAFVIETGAVKEFMGIEKGTVRKEPSGEEFVMIRGDCYPVLRLNQFFSIQEDKEKNDDREGMLIIIEVDKQMMCLLVDKLVGKQEIVVKPIPDYIKHVHGLSGCTQLGDGSIALIIDTASITTAKVS